MSIEAGPRGKEIYIQSKTKKRLYWISQLESEKTRDQYVEGCSTKITIHSVADQGLNEWMETKYPNIKVLEKRLDALEGQLIGELLNPTIEK